MGAARRIAPPRVGTREFLTPRIRPKYDSKVYETYIRLVTRLGGGDDTCSRGGAGEGGIGTIPAKNRRKNESSSGKAVFGYDVGYVHDAAKSGRKDYNENRSCDFQIWGQGIEDDEPQSEVVALSYGEHGAGALVAKT
jgi:hypothetical protein